jgi:phosphoglycolate phosphatase
MVGFRAIVFDLDGTLVDSAASIARALNRLLAEEGRPLLTVDQVKMMVGDGAMSLLQEAYAETGDALDREALAPVFPRYIDHLAKTPPAPADLYPGVIATLAALKADGFRLAVCTNKPTRATVQALRALGLTEEPNSLFRSVIAGDTLPQRKPAPEPVLAAIADLGARPDQAVMIGDTAYDINAARAADVLSIAVRYGYPRMPVEDLGADLIIDRFDELPAALETLAADAAYRRSG